MHPPPLELISVWDAQKGPDAKAVEVLRQTCDRITSSGDRLRANYAFDSLELESHLSFDMLVHVETGEVYSFAGVFRRDWWPEGIYRFQNRTWINPDMRHRMKEAGAKADGGGGDFFLNASLLGAAQIAKTRTQCRALFVSIEGMRGISRLSYLRDFVRPYWGTNDLEWTLCERYVQVAPGAASPSRQPILYANTHHGYDLAQEPWLQNAQTFDEWRLNP
jgi:hypothetical protein